MDLSDNAVRKRLTEATDAATGTLYCFDCNRHRQAAVFSRPPKKGKRRKCNDCWAKIKRRQQIQIAPGGQVSKLPPSHSRLIKR